MESVVVEYRKEGNWARRKLKSGMVILYYESPSGWGTINNAGSSDTWYWSFAPKGKDGRITYVLGSNGTEETEKAAKDIVEEYAGLIDGDI